MSKLIESIASGDFVSANKLFEQRMEQIAEKKLYESKRMMQAEAFGGLTKQEIEDRKKAGYRKAADVLGDPSKSSKISDATKKYRTTMKRKTVSKEKLDEAGLAPTAIGKAYRTFRNVHGAIKNPKLALDIAKERIGKAKELINAYRQKKDSSESPFPQSMHDTQHDAQDTSTEPKKKESGLVAAGKAALGSLASQYGS